MQEKIEICRDELFKESETTEGLRKSEFKELLSLTTKDLYFIFDGRLHKEIDGVPMGSPLGPTLANAFLVYNDKNWPERCPLKYRPAYYLRYLDDISNLLEHLNVFELLKFSSC